MTLDRPRSRQYLKDFDFKPLFIEELGWDRYSSSLDVRIDGHAFNLLAIAEKRGLVVFTCPPMADGRIPDYVTRLKIEMQVAKSVFEHIIIYTDSAKTTQVWQWVKREAGKPTARRETTFYKNQTGESLIQKLDNVAFSLGEEEELTTVDVTSRVRAAFDVERITRRFYDRFKTEHTAFLKFIKGIPDEEMQRWYASVMINRLMFIYFIQKKGFLDGDINYLRNKLAQSKQRDRNIFYSEFLCALFFKGFAEKESVRSASTNRLLGKVPYLNGGLFMRHQIEELHGKAIQISDSAFEKLFDFFEDYQWHLDERPLRRDTEINPDVLGYIFEKYINQKQMGAYYTKEDITEYISKNTIIPFIFDRAQHKCKIAFEGEHSIWRQLQADPDRYIYDAVKKGVDLPLPKEVAAGLSDVSKRGEWNKPAPEEYALPTEIWREVVARRKRYEEVRSKLTNGEIQTINDFITYNLDIRQFAQDVIQNCEGPDLLRAFWQTIEKVTVLDPTCGSGAFLFAALNILEPLYEACLDRMQVFVDELERSGEKHHPEKFGDFRKVLRRVAQHPNHRYFILKSIIVNNLFGVDIMEEATEICKLRLFLKLVAQVERDEQIEPLPDIDFNIRAGNTLVGYATYNEVKRAVTSKLDFDNAMGRIEEKAQDIDRLFKLFRQQQTELGGEVTPTDKQELRKRLRALEAEMNDHLAGEYGISRNKFEYEEWRTSHKPFHWFTEFYGIISNAGFDVIIGNPPYVEYRLVRGTYKLKPGSFRSEPADNLYAFCMERSGSLLNPSGWFGMIVPAGVLGLDDAVSLRNVLLNRFSESFCSTYAIRPSKLFDGVDQRLCIYLGTKHKDSHSRIWTTRYHHWNSEERSLLFQSLAYIEGFYSDRLKRIPQIGSKYAASVVFKLEEKNKKNVVGYYSKGRSGFLMHYHRSPRYWIRAMDFEQYFKSPTRTRSVHHFRDLYFRSENEGKVIGSILNSSLFFFWFVSIGNGRNITGTEVEQFPVGEFGKDTLKNLPRVFDQLMEDYNAKSFIRVRQDCEFQEFRPSRSKPVIDEIDSILAKHYGFADEEADFIINYDIKYRMGRDSQEEE